jgi:hypothetical protein
MTVITCLKCVQCSAYRPYRSFRHPDREDPVCKTCAFGPVAADPDAYGRNCSSCHIRQGWDQFSPADKGPQARSSHCKKCSSLQQRHRYRMSRADSPPLPPACRIDNDGRECTTCHAYQPWTAYSRSAAGPYGRASSCKDCHSQYYRDTYQPHPYTPKGLDDNGRTCTTCDTYKTWEEFHRSRSGINGRRASCKKCINAWCSEYSKRKNK